MNVVSPFFGGIPLCHESGGLAGYHAFGARTGGSVIISGVLYLLIGIAFGDVFSEIIKLFPLTISAVILLFESITFIMLISGVSSKKLNSFHTILVGMIALLLTNGFFWGFVIGFLTYKLYQRGILLRFCFQND